MKSCNYPTQAELLQKFDLIEGKLCRKSDGKPAAYLHKGTGRYVVKYKSRNLYLSRLLWIFVNGDIPDDMCVDHINREKTDNRLENLRLVSKRDNNRNVWCQRNTSGFRNVSWNKDIKKWHARTVNKNGEKIHLGFFDCVEQAAEIVQEFLKKDSPHLFS
ncbi:MAG TPA: HNH endonuclease signature motif containing protein [Allocoleopsis sp.]